MDEETNVIIGALERDLSGVPLTDPILPAGIYQLRIKSCKATRTKGGLHQLQLVFTNEEPTTSIDAEQVGVGEAVIYESVLLEPTGGWTQRHTDQRLAQIKAALGERDQKWGQDMQPYIGKTFRAYIKTTSRDSGEDRNEVSSYEPVK